MAVDWKGTDHRNLFLRPKKLKNVLERINQEMYVRNLQLTQKNRTLSLLRNIDKLVLESHISTHELCNVISAEISKTAGYPFVGILARGERKRSEFEMYGWDSRASVDDTTHQFVDAIAISGDELSWLESEEQSINLSIADLINNPHSLARTHIGTRSLGIMQDMGVKSVYIVKMSSRGHVVGMMVVGLLSDTPSNGVMSNDEDIILRLGDVVGIAIDNKLLIEENERVVKQLKKINGKLKALDEVKDEFMSMASHQLRTPLTSIKGYMSMVLEGDLGEISPQQRKVLGEAFNSSERMVRLIADFLNVSRLQTGKFLIEKTPFDLNRAVEQEVNSLQFMMSTHNLSIHLQLPKGTVPIVADESKIRQVIMNFVDNAVYYSMAGGVVTIHVARGVSGVDVTVTDSGIGVPQAEQARLFNKFFRATNARRQRPDGTGVGLYLAKKVITAHGGSMIFHSVEGKGSTFGFHLPSAKAQSLDVATSE